MRKVHIITRASLNRASLKVVGELRRHGLWSDRLSEVPVVLVPLGMAYGWQCYGSSGNICIPRVSYSKLRDYFTGDYVGLADVLRHEFAHAVADKHRGLFRSRRFTQAFDLPHESDTASAFNDANHVSAYAATQSSEDFAETFMFYLRHRGVLPTKHLTTTIRRKWRFIQSLCRAIGNSQARW